MRSTSLRLGMGLGLLSMVLFAFPACSSDDDDPKSGTGGTGGSGGTAGTAGSSGSGGSGGSTPLTCGSETCTSSWTILVLQVAGCCAGANGDACGAQTDTNIEGLFGFPVACYETDLPGEVDCGCPTFTFKNAVAEGQFNGCCTPSGACGYAIDLTSQGGPNLGCQPADDLGGPGVGQTCTVGSETPPPASGDCPVGDGGTGDAGPGDAGPGDASTD